MAHLVPNVGKVLQFVFVEPIELLIFLTFDDGSIDGLRNVVTGKTIILTGQRS